MKKLVSLSLFLLLIPSSLIYTQSVEDEDSVCGSAKRDFLSLGYSRLIPEQSSCVEPSGDTFSSIGKRADGEILREADQIAKELKDFQAGKGGDIQDIARRLESLALRSQEEGLCHETDDHVNYNPTMNSIVSWVNQWGDHYSVTTIVIKYLDDSRFETYVLVSEHGFGMMRSGKENPAIVARLKKKIAEFEETLNSSEKE